MVWGVRFSTVLEMEIGGWEIVCLHCVPTFVLALRPSGKHVGSGGANMTKHAIVEQCDNSMLGVLSWELRWLIIVSICLLFMFFYLLCVCVDVVCSCIFSCFVWCDFEV
jgi:hypothetical protein